jgi:ribonucleoside-diphosphate reductase alpha chain
MVCLDLDHPDIESFINWKVREEVKVAALVEGLKHLPEEQRKTAELLGLKLDYDFNGEAYMTVSGQNSNNSVRIGNEFFRRLGEDGQWELNNRTSDGVNKTMRARDLWDQVGYAAWRCADPGVQFDSTINQWHTCPEGGRINASNPCSEYMFLDNTACNLASLNLIKFFDADSCSFDGESFEHATRIWTIVLEISVLMAAFPSRSIAKLSYDYRTLGLGYANIGAMLMQAGIPYDSQQARAICGSITAILTGRSYATSAEMAGELGPFPGYFKNREHMLRVIRNHRRAAYGVPRSDDAAREHALGNYEGVEIKPVPIDADCLLDDDGVIGRIANVDDVVERARAAWDDALNLGKEHGYRNAQTTVIAPTGTIGLLMDCDTTGVEPDFALVKFKKLAGGGYFKIANQSLRPALENLGHSREQVKEIMTYVMGTLHMEVPMPNEDGMVSGETHETFADFLRKKGLGDDDLKQLTAVLPTVFEMPHAFNAWTLGAEAIEKLGLVEQAKDADFNLLRAIGLSRAQVRTLGRLVCGTQTVEGAPHLKDRHLPVFDCANTCGPDGKRYIASEGHIRMMAAAQPFISGAISKTINLPNSASVDDIKASYLLSWELGLKANALYRDGCKLSQPLNTTSEDDGEEDDEGIEAARQEVAAEIAKAADRAGEVEEGVTIENGEKVRTIEKIVERIVERPLRRRLPDTRRSVTHKFNVSGHEGYLTVGLYEDGTPGELFITMAKEGSTIGGLMDSLGTAISVALQYGVPMESLVNKFTHQRFEPAGMTHNPDIPFAKSLVDYIFRWMGMEFIPGYRAANAPVRPAAASSKEPAGRTAKAVAERIVKGTAPAPAPGNGNGGKSGDKPASITDAPRRITTTANDAASVAADTTAAPGDGENGGATKAVRRSAVAEAMSQMQADAPACDVCGTITVRNGTCYKCLNCGNSMGCS